MKRSRNVLTITGTVIAVMVMGKATFAEPGTLPPGQLPAFTAQWAQWALSIPQSGNPQVDVTGENCMVGQRDFVWFLAGKLGGGSATRTCSVPEDKTLFFPVINITFFNSPFACGQEESFTAQQERAAIKPFIDATQNIAVTVDDVDVKKTLLRRVQSQVFDVALPDDNVNGGPPVCPAGIYSPTVDDGFYVSLGPLTPGQHTIHFQAESPLGFSEDITYHLNVVPVSLQ